MTVLAIVIDVVWLAGIIFFAVIVPSTIRDDEQLSMVYDLNPVLVCLFAAITTVFWPAGLVAGVINQAVNKNRK